MMIGTHSIIGSVCVYLSAVLMLSCSSAAVHHSTPCHIRAPAIVNMGHRRLVNGYRLSCKVDPGGLRDETMVYWLADGEFVDQVYKDISVTQTQRKSCDGIEYLYNKVVFRGLSIDDFHTNFTCVALSPAGFAKENLRIRRDGRG